MTRPKKPASTMLGIRLAPALRDRLLAEMQASGRTADEVVAEALADHLRRSEWVREATLAIAKAGRRDDEDSRKARRHG